MLKTLLLTLAISAAALPLTSQAEDFKPSSAITVLMPIVMDNLDTLHLNATQIDQVREVSRKNFRQVEYINAQYHDIKTQLREVTLDPEGNQTQALALVAELSKLDQQRMTLTVDCAFNLKKIFTPAQFDELLNIQSFTKAK